MNSKSLYNLLGIKSKNSVFKSVIVTDNYTYENYQIIEVEPYDNTFLNATNTVNKYDNVIDRIMKKVYEYFNGQDVWLKVYTDNHGQIEILVNEFYMKQFKLKGE